MKLHIKIIAVLYLLIGGFISVGFLAANILFFNSDLFQMESSVLDDSTSFFGRLGQNWERYLEFFALYGFSGTGLLLQIFLCVLFLTFAIGLLKKKSWAKMLGFIVVFLNFISIASTLFDGYFSVTTIVSILLTLYTIYVLTSSETKQILN